MKISLSRFNAVMVPLFALVTLFMAIRINTLTRRVDAQTQLIKAYETVLTADDTLIEEADDILITEHDRCAVREVR
jgi:hypothetical protein